MNYIVFDLEFNQNYHCIISSDRNATLCPFEIIQVGAIKLDSNFITLGRFNRYVKPSIYPIISNIVTELTGITTDQLLQEVTFPDVFHDFINFIGDGESVFCIWGMTDMKVLFQNIEYHKMNKNDIPLHYINIQPYITTYLNLPPVKLLSLQSAVDLLNIIKTYDFHNAQNDAYYTSEILKTVYNPGIIPKRYDPNYVNVRPRQPRKIVDYERLLQQFEKMYDRQLSKEEQEIIVLAYKMGKTNQFIKER
jgi:inhibitor of KinA sporulation pathway (predicted exonuclease)